MKLETATRLHDAAKACADLQDITDGVTETAFGNDRILRLAVWKLIEIVGEALRRAEQTDATLVGRIPDLRLIVNTRNRITHGYDSINFSMMWVMVQTEIPGLRDTLESLLREAPDISGGLEPNETS